MRKGAAARLTITLLEVVEANNIVLGRCQLYWLLRLKLLFRRFCGVRHDGERLMRD
jgi:hypothetical protein